MVSAARRISFQILLALEGGRAHSDELLRGKAARALAPVDRKLATALVLGVLRWQIRLDQQIKDLLTRPNAKLDPEVRIALRLGAYQLLYLARIPAHAAIDQSVELTKQSVGKFAAGMVNAVLRRVARGRVSQARDREQTASKLALIQAHPAWMVERWVSFYGLDTARAICQHGQQQPPLVIRLGSPDTEDELVQAGIKLEPASVLRAARRIVAGDLTATEAFQEGRVRVQDEGSQLIGELSACGTEAGRRLEKILDACAAPGGKTLILAERYPGARILAYESSQKRLAELERRLAALGPRVECRLADAAELREGGEFDFALADVPCSGTGTLGRNPEIRHRLRIEDLARHAERQKAILHAALRTVRPSGLVVYSTCSLEPEENEQVVAAALAGSCNVRQVSLARRFELLQRDGVLTGEGESCARNCLTPEGALRLLPGALGTDGFFVALLEKTS